MSVSLVRPTIFSCCLHGHRVPCREVVEVLLHDHIAAAGKSRVLLADDGGVDGGLVHGILRAVDETEQVAIVEVLEAMHLVRHGDGAAEPRHDLDRQLEAQIHARGADVKEDVARRRDGVMLAADFTERMQFLAAAARRTAGPRRRNRTP